MLILVEMLPRRSSISNGNESRFSGLSEETFIRFNGRYMETSEIVRSTNAPSLDRIRTPPSYRICDGLTEGVVYFMMVFAPWAFGTTERWSIWTMNIACYVLGALLMAKWLIRWRTGYQPVRGNEEKAERLLSRPAGTRSPSEAERGASNTRSDTGFMGRGILRPAGLTASLATLTVVVLAYCLVSAINARSTFYYRLLAFEPHDYLPWLPHSFDSYATWQAFWMYLGLAFSFWATRDWLLGKTAHQRRQSRLDVPVLNAGGGEPSTSHATVLVPVLPARLRRLLWGLCLNRAVLGLESILQRLSPSGKLLWLVQPYFNPDAHLQFGPFAYPSKAAQYFNLLWPVCLGVWWTFRHEFKR